jgi:hypothetical protein
MIKALILILTFNATAYAPDSMLSESTSKTVLSRAINGDSQDSWGLPISDFSMACGLAYHGHIFVFESDIPEEDVRYCTDSVENGLYNKRIDIAIVYGTNDERVESAIKFGRRKLSAKVIPAKEFLLCRGLSVSLSKVQIHKAVLAQLYLKNKDCL